MHRHELCRRTQRVIAAATTWGDFGSGRLCGLKIG
jgi:hypothetical protein